MVEATMVFPLVFLSLIMVVFFLAFMFMQVEKETNMHMALWSIEGEASSTSKSYGMSVEDILYMEGQEGLYQSFQGEESLAFQKRGLMNKLQEKKIHGRVYQLEEKKMIRYVDFFQ